MGLTEEKPAEAPLHDRFISHVSHELRTPLTAIYFFVSNVHDGLLGDLTPEQREHLALALDNVRQLKDMVSDLLDLTRLDTHKLAIEPQKLEPARFAAEAVNTCRNNALDKKITLRSLLSANLPFVWADPSRVRQILTNLIDNAIKFTPRGGFVTLQGTVAPDEPGLVCFSVTDTGPGIAVKDREIIFDRLAQLKKNSDEGRSGLGLGLFIARDLVVRQGGRIWVESEYGKGSTFFFTLPILAAESASENSVRVAGALR